MTSEQGKGTGFTLEFPLVSQAGLDIARERQVERVIGVVLTDNHSMINLCRKLGFYSVGSSVCGEAEMRIDSKGC